MEKLIEKLDNYNIFNFLFPGVVFIYILKIYIGIDLMNYDWFYAVFIAYFAGFYINIFGSLFIEPILKKAHVIHFSDYEDYIFAEKEDSKIQILMLYANMYRTVCSMLILIVSTKYLCIILAKFEVYYLLTYIVLVFLLVLGILAYKKKIDYINKRIAIVKQNK